MKAPVDGACNMGFPTTEKSPGVPGAWAEAMRAVNLSS